ncbi:MAG: hypothetical protein ACE5KM_20430 [Planctomycetaceae bacterium]
MSGLIRFVAAVVCVTALTITVGLVLWAGSSDDPAAADEPIPSAKPPADVATPSNAKTTERPKPKIDVPPPLPERATEAKIAAALGKRISVDWVDVRLSDAVANVAELAGVPIHIDKKALADEGILLDTQVNLILKNANVETVLHHGFRLPLVLGWLVEDEAVSITTVTKARNDVWTTRVYDVSHLIRSIRQRENDVDGRALKVGTLHPIDAYFGPNLERQWGDFDEATKVGAFREQPGGGIARSEYWRSERRILRSIKETIAHTSGGDWSVDLESGGTIEDDGRSSLIVRQTYAAHQELAESLRVLGAVVSKQTSGTSAFVKSSSTYPSADDAAIRRALSKRLTADYRKTPLTDVVADLRKRAGVPILLDTQRLADEGIAQDVPVTMKVANVTFRSLLNRILKPLKLLYDINHGILLITDEGRMLERQYTGIYDVSDLVVEMRGGVRALTDALQTSTDGPWNNSVGGLIHSPCPGIFCLRHNRTAHEEVTGIINDLRRTRLTQMKSSPKDEPQRKKPLVTLETVETRFYRVANSRYLVDLVRAIPRFVDSQSWKGPSAGTIDRIGDSLIIRQTVRNHVRIMEFLDAHRSVNPFDLIKPKPASRD